MKRIKQNIKGLTFFLLIIFLINSCVNEYSRITIQNLSIGDNLSPDKFIVLKDYKNLDFPYKEVVLKNDSNVILKIIGENNTIFEIRRKNLSNEEQKGLIITISNKLDSQPDSSINIILSNIWRCNMYSWLDLQTYDKITLSSCVHKNNELIFRSIWELKVDNDTILNILNKKYNQFH